ncbi:MAG: MFS transporter [Actinomycetota bacterium]
MAVEEVGDASKPKRAPSPLRRRELKLYFTGNTVSNIGTWLNNVALAVYMRHLTGSSFWVGVSNFGLFIPVIIFALPAGVLADRVDRLRLLIRAQWVMGVLAIGLTVLVGAGRANRYSVTAIAFGFGIGVALAIPTMQALIPVMVPPEEMGEAIGLNALTFNLARIVGPLIAAVALATLGATWAFGLNAASFFVLIATLMMIGTVPFPRHADKPPGPIREGLVYAWRHLRTRWMMLSIVAIGVALDPIITLSPALSDQYGLKTGGAGWIVAAWGAGGALMIVLGRNAIRAMTHHGLGWVGLLMLFGGVLGLGGAPNLGWAVPACLLAGAGYISATMSFTTTIQEDVPESLRGRVSALWTLAFLAPRAFAAVAEGALSDHIGPRITTSLFSVVALIAAVALRRVAVGTGEPIPPPA